MKKQLDTFAGLDEADQHAFLRQAVEGMTLGSVIGLVKHLEDAWDVEAAPKFDGMPDTPKDEVEEPEVEEFDVLVAETGSTRIKVVKEVRVIMDSSLKEASELLKKLPAKIHSKVDSAKAQAVKEQLEELGATVEVKASQ